MSPRKKPKNIVIIGAGFGGVYTYLKLHRYIHRHQQTATVTIINDRDYFLFVPLIHEVATGNLAPSDITQPIRQLPYYGCCNEFIEARVTAVNLDKRIVTFQKTTNENSLSRGSFSPAPSSYPLKTAIYSTATKRQSSKNVASSSMRYDYLVSALGSETNVAAIPGATKYALTLNDLEDAKKIKNWIITCFEKAQTVPAKERKRLLRFIIIGGGPTGVELAGELVDLLTNELKQAFPELVPCCQVVIIQRQALLLPQMQARLGREAEKLLHRNNEQNVRIMLNHAVKKITPQGIQTADGRSIAAATVIVTIGIKAKQIKFTARRPVDFDPRTNRIKVSNTLNLLSYPEVFVVGDQAWICNKEQQPYPMRAQFAVREGVCAGENIWRSMRDQPLREFQWNDKGFIVSLGKGKAVAQIFGFNLRGPLAWWFHRAAHLSSLFGRRAKLRTTLEWIMNFFLPRDISKL